MSPGNLQFSDLISEMMDSNLKAFVDRAAMRGRVVEAGAHDVVRILKTPAANHEPLHLVSAVGHRMEIRNHTLGDFATALAKSGDQACIVPRCADEHVIGPEKRKAEEREGKKSGNVRKIPSFENNHDRANYDKEKSDGGGRPLAEAT